MGCGQLLLLLFLMQEHFNDLQKTLYNANVINNNFENSTEFQGIKYCH